MDKGCNQVSSKLWSTLSLQFMSPPVPPALVQNGHGSAPSSFQHGIVVGKELTVDQEISPISQIWLLFWQHIPGCQSHCISHWEGKSHPVPALTHCKCTHTLTSKAHTISLCLQHVQGNPLQLLKDWKHKKGFYKSFHHRTAIALLAWPCRVKATGYTWPECVCMYVQESLPEVSRE